MTYHYSSFRAGSRFNNNQSTIVDENDKAVGPMTSRTTNTNDIDCVSNDTILEEKKIQQQQQQNWQSKKSILVLKQEELQGAEEDEVVDVDELGSKVMMEPVDDATTQQPDVGDVPISSDVMGWKETSTTPPITATAAATTTTATTAAISTEDDVTTTETPLPLPPPVVSARATLSDILVAASAVFDDSPEGADAAPNDANRIATTNILTPTAASKTATTGTTATTTSIPRCVCSWKNCRAYQKAFRQIQHPLFDGVIRIKLVKDHAESMAYQQCLKRVLGIQNEPEWKVQSSPPSKQPASTAYFCKYIIAKHHFTEQHIRKYEENVKTFSFVKPFSYHGAKKYLYKIDLNETTTSNANSSTGDSSKNSKDVSYFQCPNVPSDIVKVEYHNIVETIRRRKNATTNSPQKENQQQEEAEHAVVDDESPPTTTTATVRSSSQEESMIGYDSVDVTASSCGNTTTKASNVPPPAAAKKRTQTTTLSSSYDDCDYSTSSRPPSSHNNDNDTTSLVSYMTSATTEMLRRKDIENRLLKEQLDAMKSQLSFLHDMVQKLQEQHFDGTSSVYSSGKKSRASRSQSRPNQNKNITAGTRRGSKKFTATKIATENNAKLQQRSNQNSTGNKNAMRQQQQRVDNKPRDEDDDDVDDDDNDDNEEYCNDTASRTWSLLDDASEVQTQATFHSKFNMLSLRSNDDDESDEDDNDDDECYSYADCMSIGASTILSASRSVKSLPRELELDEDDDDTTEDDDDDEHDDVEHDDDVSSFRCDNSTAKSMNSRKNQFQQQQRHQQSPCDASHQSAGTFATPNSYQAGGKNRIKLRQLRVSNGSGNNKNKIRSRNRINGKKVGGSSIVSMHNSSTCSSTASNTIEGNDIIAMSPAAASSITCSIVSPASFDDIKSGSNNKNTNTYRRSIRRSASPASRTTNSSEGGGGRGNDSKSSVYEVTAMAVTDPYGEKGTYTGSISQASGMPHGHGRLEYDDAGRWYEGNWRHGRWTGHGRLSNGDGDYYEGGVKDDLKHGRGFMQFADGRTFSGRYFNGQMVHGKMTYEDGSTYDGSWVEGMRHGFGRCVFADSSVYQGEFKDGEFCGRGKMTWNDGGWYDGEWCNGEMHGYGREVRYDGSLRHDGEWWRGQPVRQ